MKDKDHNNKNLPEPQYKIVHGMQIQRYHFSTIDSTNSWAKANVENWTASSDEIMKETDFAMTLVTAEEQTGGRGRFNRLWESPRGVNIYATFCFLVAPTRSDIRQIPQLLALAASQVLETYQFSPLIKWPNDILIQGKKIAGILCETTMHESLLGVVCGIGLNVNMTKETIEKIN